MSFLGTGFGGASGGYSITNSIRLNGTSDYLSKTLTTSATTSGSVWVKRSKLSAVSPIFDNKVYFTSGDALHAFGLTSTALYRDLSAWYHIFWNGTGAYVNGTLVTGSGTYAAASVTNPRLGFDGTNYFSGCLSDVAFWDGSSASLQGGATNTDGVWAAERPSAGYSFLAFGSSGALGTDTSGNGNNWTVSGSPVQTTDTPTSNSCTFSAIDKGTSSTTISGGGMVATLGAGSHQSARGTIFVNSGKWYFETTLTTSASTSMTGVSQNGQTVDTYVGATAGGWAVAQSGDKYNNATPVAYLSAFNSGDVVCCALDMDSGKIWWRKNNEAWPSSGDPVAGTNAAYTGITGPVAPTVSSNGGAVWTANFGATAFAYTPPTGFKALCTTNLPAVSIANPSDHFDIVLDTGANIKTSSEALYTYFLEWIKDRANANNHQLIDTVRGSSAVLQSNTTAAETTYSAPAGSSVGWVWNAGGAAVSNTSGSITSSVSANTAAGFSVVTYTGTGVNATVGHGLGATPKFIIVKQRDSGTTENWAVWHAEIANTEYLLLNSANAKTTGATYWNSTSPSSTVFSVGAANDTNESGKTFVAYCFAEISGYSKFGSYVGNGSADGPFVFCGFCPRYILTKLSSTAGGEWIIYDVARSTYNPATAMLSPDSASSESAYGSGTPTDITSNGFKLRVNSSYVNYSGHTHIFAAFAEFPFGGSNVAPSPAR